VAYAGQAAATTAMALAVVKLWRSSCSFNLKAAALVVGSLAATPYLLDYDLIILGLAIVFLAADGRIKGFDNWELSALALLWLWPLLSRSVAGASGIQFTPIMLAGLMYMIVTKATDTHYQPMTRLPKAG